MSDDCLSQDLLMCHKPVFHSSFRVISEILNQMSEVSSRLQTNGHSWSEDSEGYFNLTSSGGEKKAKLSLKFADNVLPHYRVSHMQFLFQYTFIHRPLHRNIGFMKKTFWRDFNSLFLSTLEQGFSLFLLSVSIVARNANIQSHK